MVKTTLSLDRISANLYSQVINHSLKPVFSSYQFYTGGILTEMTANEN